MPTNNVDHTFYAVIIIILDYFFPFFIRFVFIVKFCSRSCAYSCRAIDSTSELSKRLHTDIHVIFFFTIFLHPDRIYFFCFSLPFLCGSFVRWKPKKIVFSLLQWHSPSTSTYELRLHYILSLWVFICSLYPSVEFIFLLVSNGHCPSVQYITTQTSYGVSSYIENIFICLVWAFSFAIRKQHSHIFI